MSNKILKTLIFEDLSIQETGYYEFFTPNGDTSIEAFDKDGVSHDATTEILGLLPHLKKKGEEKTDFSLLYDGIRYRCAVMKAIDGVWYVLRKSLPEVPSLDDLEYTGLYLKNIVETGRKSGLIIATGATGSGKTTFLNTLLKKYLETYGGRAVTIEDPPEMKIGGEYKNGRCFQMSVDEGSFDVGLKNSLRYRPRYILIGELRTKEAAITALRAATTGHLVFTTIHGSNISQAMLGMISLASQGGQTDLAWKQLAESIQMVACLSRSPGTPLPSADFFLMNMMPSEEGTRNKIRDGNIETLQDDISMALTRLKLKK